MPAKPATTDPRKTTAATTAPPARHVSLVALPDAVVSTLYGIYDVMNAPALLGKSATVAGRASLMPPPRGDGAAASETAPPQRRPFQIEIVGERAGPLALASGVAVDVQRAVDDIDATDIVIVPSIVLRSAADGWLKGRYPKLVDWLRRVHERGALLCSACSGIFLLAETGVFDGRDATVHFGYAREFAVAHPAVPIHPERVLVVSGLREELVSSGASTTWHDMVLYLIARHAGATDAQEVARLFALQWHQDGLAPYIVFEGRADHGDAEIESAQRWLATHFSVANPVEEMIKRSKLAERTFKRRFTAATGLAPIAYVQRLRIEDAKRRLERTDAPVDEIGWRVGYEDAAFFRRLFRRTTGMAPGAYRKRFRIPEFARGRGGGSTHARPSRPGPLQ
jgi:transcriptional regulator GlxA family with amidase domain